MADVPNYANGHLSVHTLPDISVRDPVDDDNVDELANFVLDEDLDSHFGWPRLDGERENWQRSMQKDGSQEMNPEVKESFDNRWARSEPQWHNRLGDGWRFYRFLGEGGFGMAAAYRWERDLVIPEPENDVPRKEAQQNPQQIEREGPDAENRDFEEQIRYLVVKQQRAYPGRTLQKEAKLMQRLNQTGSTHFPRIYKRAYRDIGKSRRGWRKDSDRREVHRIFMEYLAHGDMEHCIKRMKNEWDDLIINMPVVAGPMFREDMVWYALVCLAKALIVLERGHEDPATEPWGGPALIHFDLKPANVFIGEKDQNEHNVVPILKVGDLGLMSEMIPLANQDDEYLDYMSHRGTSTFWSPEMERQSYAMINGIRTSHRHVPLPRGSRTFTMANNVFGVGVILFNITTLNSNGPSGGRTFRSHLSSNLKRGDTMGEDLVLGIYHPKHPRHETTNEPLLRDHLPPLVRFPLPYSTLLKALILECLMERPQHRPNPTQLLRRALEGLQIAQAAQGAQAMEPGLPNLADAGFDPFQDMAPQAPVQAIPVPPAWISNEPPYYWQRPISGDMYVGRYPLSALVERQRRDLQRYSQVWRARERRGDHIPDEQRVKIVAARNNLLFLDQRKDEWIQALDQRYARYCEVHLIVHIPSPGEIPRLGRFVVNGVTMTRTLGEIKQTALDANQGFLTWAAGDCILADDDARPGDQHWDRREDISIEELILNHQLAIVDPTRRYRGELRRITLHLHERGDANTLRVPVGTPAPAMDWRLEVPATRG